MRFLQSYLKKSKFDTSDLTKKIGVNLVIKLFGVSLGYLNILIISNLYGVSSYGLFILCFTIVSITQVIPKFGLENSILKLINEFDFSQTSEIKETILKALSITLVLGIFFSVLLYYTAPEIAHFLNKYWIVNDIRTMSYILIPLSYIFLFGAILQALNYAKEYMLLVTVLLQLLFMIFLLVNNIFEFNYGVIEVYAYSIILGFCISFILLVKRLKNKKITFSFFKKEKNLISYKRVINTSLPMLLSTSIFLIMGWTDILMLGYYTSEKLVGIFSASLKLSLFAGISLGVVNSVVTPKFAALFNLNKIDELKKLVKHSTKLIFYLATPFLLIFLLFPQTILSLLGSEYINGSRILIILTIGQVFNALCGSVGLLMLMTNQQKLNKNIIFAATILNAILNYYLIPSYSILGAAIANMCSLIFWNLLMIIAVKRNLGFWTFYLPFSKTN